MEKDELLLLEASVDAWIRGYDSALDDFSKKQEQLSVAALIKKCRKDVLEMLQQNRYLDNKGATNGLRPNQSS